MTNRSNIIALPRADQNDPFLIDRGRLTNLLLRHCLVESFYRFISNRKPYPFANPNQLLPSQDYSWIEHHDQNAVLMFIIDGKLPRPLNKHFRLRASNKVTWRNIHRLAPDLDLSEFKAKHCRLDDVGFADLLPKLISFDYALLAERQNVGESMALSHMHVKVERLTDTAIKELGKELGYVERRLFERGDDYVEVLENKFFEYFGFSANAAGRKSAAAMATQLLSVQGKRFTVFVAGHEDCRLTVLDQSPLIEQYLLIKLTGLDLKRFHLAASAAGVEDLSAYSVERLQNAKSQQGTFTTLYRLTLERTPAAQPLNRSDRDLLKPWLKIKHAEVLPRPGCDGLEIPFRWDSDLH